MRLARPLGIVALLALAAAPERHVAGVTLFGAFDLHCERWHADLTEVGRQGILRELRPPETRHDRSGDPAGVAQPSLVVYGTQDS